MREVEKSDEYSATRRELPLQSSRLVPLVGIQRSEVKSIGTEMVIVNLSLAQWQDSWVSQRNDIKQPVAGDCLRLFRFIDFQSSMFGYKLFSITHCLAVSIEVWLPWESWTLEQGQYKYSKGPATREWVDRRVSGFTRRLAWLWRVKAQI